jgi:hypothetical protein
VSPIGRPVTHYSSGEQIRLFGLVAAAGAQSACFVSESVGAPFVDLLRVACLDTRLADAVGHRRNDDAHPPAIRPPIEVGCLWKASIAETTGTEDTVWCCCSYSESQRINATFRGAAKCEVSRK